MVSLRWRSHRTTPLLSSCATAVALLALLVAIHTERFVIAAAAAAAAAAADDPTATANTNGGSDKQQKSPPPPSAAAAKGSSSPQELKVRKSFSLQLFSNLQMLILEYNRNE